MRCELPVPIVTREQKLMVLLISFCPTASAARTLLTLTNLRKTPFLLQMIVEWPVRCENYFSLTCSLLGLEAKHNIYVGSIQIMI